MRSTPKSVWWAVLSLVVVVGTASCGSGSPPKAGASHAPGRIAFQGEGRDESTDIYFIDASGDDQRRLTTTGTDSSPSWSPDGKLIAFTSGRDGNAEIYVMGAEGGSQRRLTKKPEPDSTPAWSPDGSRIMFTHGSCDAEKCDLFVMNADGSDARRLTRGGESHDGSWSPDGKQIVFWSGRDFGSGIYVMDDDGTGVRPLTLEFETAWGPDWSPDGKSILFVGSKDDPSGDEVMAIYRMNADGSNAEQVALPTGYWIDEPEWSPDGKSIAFFSDGQGPGAIWVMSADGTGQLPLTSRGDSHSPSWQP